MMSQYRKTPFIKCSLDPAISVTLGAGINHSPTVLSALQRLHVIGHLPAYSNLYSKTQVSKFVPQVMRRCYWYRKTKFVRVQHIILRDLAQNVQPCIYLIRRRDLWTGIGRKEGVMRVCKVCSRMGVGHW